MFYYTPKSKQITSTWSGGTTTQLLILPEGSDYAKRTFDFRISTATIEVEESTFSDLTGYKRHLIALTRGITLFQNQSAAIVLEPLTCFTFNGGDATKSVGTTTDFNVMERPCHTSTVEVHDLKSNDTISYCVKSLAIYCLEGNLTITSPSASITMNALDFLHVTEEAITLYCTENAKYILVTLDL